MATKPYIIQDLSNDMGAVTDARQVGPSGGGGGSGMTEALKQATYQCFEDVAWEDPDTRAADLAALFAALYPVSSLSAVYTQSGAVYETDNLDVLEDDLVVTATYEDGTTGVIPAGSYTLSGTLTEGSSTITVTYSGKTATFTVNVETAMWSIKNEAFDGGFISTYIPMCNEDRDWTIAFDVTLDTNPTSGDASSYKLPRLIDNSGLCYSIAFYKKNGNSTNYSMQYMATEKTITGATVGTGRIRFVITHAKDSGKASIAFRKDSGEPVTDSISATFSAATPNVVIGQTNGANQLPKGTLNFAAIYYSVFSQTSTEDFLGV